MGLSLSLSEANGSRGEIMQSRFMSALKKLLNIDSTFFYSLKFFTGKGLAYFISYKICILVHFELLRSNTMASGNMLYCWLMQY